MKRGAPLRRTPLARGSSQLKRTGRLKPMSDKTRSEIPERKAVREEALRLAGNRCQMAEIVPEVQCWHPAGQTLDVDEVCSRGVNPGGHLDPTNVRVACRSHHQWRTEHPEEAHARGLRVKSWEAEQRRRTG